MTRKSLCDKEFNEFKNYYREIHGIDISDEAGNLDLESVSESLEGTVAVLRNFLGKTSWKAGVSERFDGTMGTDFAGEIGLNADRFITREAALV